MLNDTKLKTYAKAYRTRMNRGEKVSEIDKLYLDMKRLTEEEVTQIHNFLKLRNID